MRVRSAAVVAVLGTVSAMVALGPATPASAATPTCNDYQYDTSALAWVPDVDATGSFTCNMVQGDESPGVYALQIALDMCYGENLQADGQFGSLTKEALERAQHTASTTVDGQYGPHTRAAMKFYSGYEGACVRVP